MRITSSIEERWSYMWLAVGAILFTFGSARWTIPAAAWLWPIFILRFLRIKKPLPGLLFTFIIFCIGNYIKFSAIMGLPISRAAILFPLMSVALILPFVLDRFISHRLQGFLSTLLFPLAWTSMEFFVSFGSSGSWLSMAYSMYGNLPLEQVVSVTGIYGITFLVFWFAAIVNIVWEHNFVLSNIKGVVGLYVCIFVAVLLFGGARLAFFPPDGKTVRVASIMSPPGDNIVRLVTSRDKRNLLPVEKNMETMQRFSAKGAQSGAKIVTWNEYAFRLFKRDEATFITYASGVALRENIYLLVAMGVFPEEPGAPVENKFVFIDPAGKVLWRYLKGHPVPLVEEPYVVKGDSTLPVVDTSYGRIAVVNCFDLDFPRFIRQAGQAGADILIGPSEDWKELLSTHTQMTTFRAVENGFSFIRCTYEGLSMSVDYQGRILNSMNYFNTDESVIVADVPIKGVSTIYPKIGDLFAWLCCAGLIVIVVWAFVHRREIATNKM